jgi:hypothetical protein
MKNFFLSLCLFSTSVFAQVLPANSPERQQLIAMGWDIEKEEPGDSYTLADLGSTRLVFSKNEERLSVSRVFNVQRKLSKDDEFELLKILNKFNKNFAYQFSLGEQSLTATVYYYGPHDARAFARLIRQIDKVNVIFDTEPKFFKLVNN